MLYPSIDDLKKKINSKYSLVSLAAKRARQLQEGAPEKLGKYVSYKPVGKALEEIAFGKLKMKKRDQSTVYEDEI